MSDLANWASPPKRLLLAHFRSSLLVVVIINQLLQGAGCSVCLSVRTPFGGLELGNGRYGKKLRDIWPIPRAACFRLLVLQLSEIRAFLQVFLFAIVHRHSFAFNLRLDVFNFFWNLFSRKKRANQQNSITRSLPTATQLQIRIRIRIRIRIYVYLPVRIMFFMCLYLNRSALPAACSSMVWCGSQTVTSCKYFPSSVLLRRLWEMVP